MFADPICYLTDSRSDSWAGSCDRAENPSWHLNAAQQSDAQVNELEHE